MRIQHVAAGGEHLHHIVQEFACRQRIQKIRQLQELCLGPFDLFLRFQDARADIHHGVGKTAQLVGQAHQGVAEGLQQLVDVPGRNLDPGQGVVDPLAQHRRRVRRGLGQVPERAAQRVDRSPDPVEAAVVRGIHRCPKIAVQCPQPVAEILHFPGKSVQSRDRFQLVGNHLGALLHLLQALADPLVILALQVRLQALLLSVCV